MFLKLSGYFLVISGLSIWAGLSEAWVPWAMAVVSYSLHKIGW